MSNDEPTQEEVDDAIIEDTVHCDFCGTSWVLGSYGDGITLNLPKENDGTTKIGPQLKLCIDCASDVARAYETEVCGLDRCEHDVLTGDWCPICHAAYRAAREDPENQ